MACLPVDFGPPHPLSRLSPGLGNDLVLLGQVLVDEGGIVLPGAGDADEGVDNLLGRHDADQLNVQDPDAGR